jgi:hypothetical protein
MLMIGTVLVVVFALALAIARRPQPLLSARPLQLSEEGAVGARARRDWGRRCLL